MLAYLARYTHRVAIANSRLIALDERGVTFRYKDYRRNGQARYRTMTLAADEFIRRFLLHVLPKGFHRIRHYGLLASAGCKANIARARELIAAPVPLGATDGAQNPNPTAGAATDHRPPCPCCGGRMIIVEIFERVAHRAARHRVVPGSGPRHHDERRHLIAPSARRGRLFPASQPCRPGASNRRSPAAEHAKITAKTAAAAKIATATVDLPPALPTSATQSRLLPYQIPIDGKPPANPRGFLP